ncbi:MAG: N-acetylglucosamine-6-phosphate deacetylase [Clostridia bacterium]|nr:N-acetylglucosamine-6-phosphate deacetylase [Clostridia bacterium]
MIIRNAMVYTPDHCFRKEDILIRDGRIRYGLMPEPGEETLEAEGLYALPGLVDIHFHGANGAEFSDGEPEGLRKIAQYEASRGVLAICPATMTLSEEQLLKVMHTAREHRNTSGADLAGINLEGPFISPKKPGAMDQQFIRPADIAEFRRLQEASGNRIRLVDVAPEEKGNLEFIRQVGKEVRISIAHTDTDYDGAWSAFTAGARQMTHLFNAMNGIHHRNPGPVLACLESGADAELITDGIHIHPAVVRMVFRLFGEERVILVSDSMMATGLRDGNYHLGGQDVTVEGKHVFLTRQPGTIAGSATDLYGCMCEAVSMGIPLESAVRAASENPARAIGIAGEYGSLGEGAWGNVILADRALGIRAVIQKGKRIGS